MTLKTELEAIITSAYIDGLAAVDMRVVLADQIIALLCQPEASVVEIIEDWIEQNAKVTKPLYPWTAGEALAARLEAHWNARTERWFVSAETLRKLKAQRALWWERKDNDMPWSHYSADMLAGFDAALRIYGHYEAVTKGEVQP